MFEVSAQSPLIALIFASGFVMDLLSSNYVRKVAQGRPLVAGCISAVSGGIAIFAWTTIITQIETIGWPGVLAFMLGCGSGTVVGVSIGRRRG